MKAIYVTTHGDASVLQVQETEIPKISSKQVLIRVEAASVNFADIKARMGAYHGASNPPFIPGLDAAGVIEEVGEEITRFKKGDRVIAFPSGSYAEYVAADEDLTFAISNQIDFHTAAACPIVAFTSYNLLNQVTMLQAGESVVVHSAAGGIGTTAIQIAKLLGAKQVIGTVGSNEKKRIAIDAGADAVFNYKDENFSAEVLELTDGKGADVILDSVGGEIFNQSLDCLAMFGRIANFSNPSGEFGGVNTNELHKSCRSVLGYSFGTYRKHRPEAIQTTAEQVLPLVGEKKINFLISEKFALEDAAKAHEHIESRKSIGKILLLP